MVFPETVAVVGGRKSEYLTFGVAQPVSTTLMEKMVASRFIEVDRPNAKVSDGSQPPMVVDLSLSESAGSRSLARLVQHSS